MSKSDDEQYLDFLRYQEVKPDTVSRKDTKWLSSREAKREVKRQAKEDRKRGR